MADVGISVAMRGLDGVTRGFGRIGTGARDAGAQAQAASRGVDSLANSMRRLQQVVLGAGLFQLAKGAVETSLAFQKMERVLSLATGSVRGGAEAMKFARTEADRLGLNLKETASGFSRMMIAAKGTALEGEAAKKIFVGVSEASAVMGLTADETAGAFRAIEQMISKGNVSAEELRGQLGERLPGAFNIMARAMGVTTTELNKMLEQGLVQASDVLPKFAAELQRTFGGGIKTAANSAQAAINRFGTAWNDVQIAFANSGFLDGVVVAMQDLARTSKDPEFVASLKSIGSALGDLIKLTGTAVDVIGKSIQGWRLMAREAAGFMDQLTGMDDLATMYGVDDASAARAKADAATMARGRANERTHSSAKHGVRRVGPSTPTGGRSIGGGESALKARIKADEDAIREAEENADRIAQLNENIWRDAQDMIERTRTPLDAYNDDLQRLELAYKDLPGGAKQFNDILSEMNIELANSNGTVRAFESAFDRVFDAAIEGGKNFMDVLEDIGRSLAKDLLSENVLSPLKNLGKNLIGGMIGGGMDRATGRASMFGVSEASAVMGLTADETAGAFRAIEQMISKGNVSAEELRGQLGGWMGRLGDDGDGGGGADPMQQVFDQFLGGLGTLLGGGEDGFIGMLQKLFMGGDEGVLGGLGKLFTSAWEGLGTLFTWFIGEETALALWRTAEEWAIVIWRTAEEWAIAIFNAAMSIFGFETGGDVTVTRPTLIMVGEKNKAERVRVSPLGGPPRASAQQQVNRLLDQHESQNMLQPNVNVYLPASSVINDLTAGHFARQISGAVRRQSARYV